jgi:hypothetical protein
MTSRQPVRGQKIGGQVGIVGGWSNGRYDRLVDSSLSTLPWPERIQQIVQMAKIMGNELPAITYYFSPDGVAYAEALTGRQAIVPDVPRRGMCMSGSFSKSLLCAREKERPRQASISEQRAHAPDLYPLGWS